MREVKVCTLLFIAIVVLGGCNSKADAEVDAKVGAKAKNVAGKQQCGTAEEKAELVECSIEMEQQLGKHKKPEKGNLEIIIFINK